MIQASQSEKELHGKVPGEEILRTVTTLERTHLVHTGVSWARHSPGVLCQDK